MPGANAFRCRPPSSSAWPRPCSRRRAPAVRPPPRPRFRRPSARASPSGTAKSRPSATTATRASASRCSSASGAATRVPPISRQTRSTRRLPRRWPLPATRPRIPRRASPIRTASRARFPTSICTTRGTCPSKARSPWAARRKRRRSRSTAASSTPKARAWRAANRNSSTRTRTAFARGTAARAITSTARSSATPGTAPCSVTIGTRRREPRPISSPLPR